MTTILPLGSLPTYHAQQDPGRACLTHGGQTISRGEFEARANRRARALANHGVGHGDHVALILPNCAHYFELAFALWKIGATPVPISPSATDRELAVYFELIEPKLILSDRAFGSGFPEILVDGAVDETLSAEPVPEIVSKFWRIVMSGGSTGRPKLIVDRTPGLADPNIAVLQQKVGGTHLNPGPLYHSGPFGVSARGLFVGSHLVNMEKFDPIGMLGLIERYRADWAYFVPTMMHRIWRLPEEERNGFDLSSLEVAFHTASACPPWLKQAWIDWLGPTRIWEMYGSAENVGYTLIRGDEWLAHRGSVGRMQGNAHIAIFDENGERAPTGQVGEVYFLSDEGSENRFHYIGANRKAIGDWQSFGDLGYVDEDDYLYIVDRRTDMIVSGGVNVYPAEIEAVLDSHPDVSSSVVIGLPDADLGSRVHAIVQAADHARDPLSDEVLRSWLKGQLVNYKVPRSIEFVTHPLRDNAGKVRRGALRDERIAQLAQRPLDMAAAPK